MTTARNAKKAKKAKTPIPEGMGSAAAADFFATHDATELAWEPAQDVAIGVTPLAATFSIRFEAKHKDAIWQLAEARHERPTAMLRRWILERLASEGAIDTATVDLERLATAVAELVAAQLRPLLADH